MASTLQIDENPIRRLKRPELQKLAREHKIKANLKSEVIIDLLLHRLADATKHQTDGPSSVAQHADSMPPSVDDDNSRDRPSERLIAIPTNPNPRQSLETPTDAQLLNQPPKGSVFRPAQDRGPSYPGSPPDIENFDEEQLAAPESLVRETVAMLAELDKGDQQLMDQIINMRRAMSKLRSQTQNTRALLRSENARRRRAVQYYLYWHPITNNWSYEEVWSGKVKVRDDEDIVGFTTSDEEDWEEKKGGGNNAVPTTPQNSHLYDSIINNIERTEENGASEAEELLSPIGILVTDLETFNTIMGQKRLRSRSPPDDGRHAPRRRVEQQAYLKTPEGGFNFISPPQTPVISTRIDKGKAKMTTEQVEKLEREHAVERLLAEVAAEVHDRTAGSYLELIRERAAPEEYVVRYDDGDCHGEGKAAVLEVLPTDSHGEDGEEFGVAEYPKIVLDYNNPLVTQPVKASTEVQAEAQMCIIEPGQNREQENVKTGGDRKDLRISTFSSASHYKQ